jgi:hypothetical protein
MKSVTAAELGAVGAWRVFDQGDRVGTIVFNDESSVEIRPLRSRIYMGLRSNCAVPGFAIIYC